MHFKRKISVLFAALSTVVLVACGGGGGSSTPTPAPSPAPTPAPTPQPTPQPTPEPTPAPMEASLLSVNLDGSAYDIIQIYGANSGSTPGGSADAGMKSVYV